jgi:formylglycine-generating enzyme required for sulfatase activity
MRLRIAVAIVLALLVGSSVYGAQWKMRVHQPGANTDYTVSEIDSVTFYYDEAPGMVLVPAGTFTMGDGSAGNGEAEFDVTLTNDFYLDQHEVTNQEYIDAVQWAYDNGHVTVDVNRVYDNLDGSTEDLLDLSSDDCEIEFSEVDSTFVLVDSLLADHPTKVVTWYGAARYCDWLSLQEDPPRDRAYEPLGRNDSGLRSRQLLHLLLAYHAGRVLLCWRVAARPSRHGR